MTKIIKKYRLSVTFLLFGAVLLLSVLFNACGTAPPPQSPPGYPKPYRVMGKWYQPIPDSLGFRQKGVASWYGEYFHGKRTSNGEIYDMHAMTAAHKTLPLGTVVRVTHLETNREVTVRINDRGPFVKERVIDLSVRAAKEIGIFDEGTGPVEIVAVESPASSSSVAVKSAQGASRNFYSGNFTIQVGAFTDRPNAEQLVRSLSRTYKNAHISEYYDGQTTFYRIRVGRTHNLEEAVRYEAHLIQNGYPQAFIVAE